jgi:WD40 repeat protein
LTKQDFLQGYVRLLKRLDAQKTMSQDILDELHTGFDTVATSDQVEELKQLLLQLTDHPAQKPEVKISVFISYARADDEPFVEKLYNDLKDDFDVWWDRETMSNRGKTFLQEIRDAIDWSDRLILIAGPYAFTSDYVRDEWQYAYETYKGINVALRLGDYSDFPEQLSGFDAPDFRDDTNYEDRLETLKRQLSEPLAPVGKFHNVPALPPHFLNRPEDLDTLRDLVIADVDKPTLISAEKRTTAVEGMGGIGKSVLATAFAHDRKVRFAFPDGIVWLTVGREPSMYELYRAVGVALGDQLSNYPDETTARQNAQKALADTKCLLILDDLWELPVGRAFRDLISGTLARLLVTTRNLQINDLLNANECRLRLIDESQAVDYLRSWVGDDPKLDEIAKKLGYLFLALKLAGARMKKDNLNGAEFLRSFDRVSRMKINPHASEREDSLEASIMLSVEAAFDGTEDENLLYHACGIFPEDTAIPQQTILQLWRYLRPDADDFGLWERLNALVDLALVERNTIDRTITLHDLLRNYTREKLGERYVQTHQDLLDSYRVDKWHQLPLDETYMWWNIGYHLINAGKASKLQELLLDINFLQAKLNFTNINAVLADCNILRSDSTVALIESTLKMSSHIIASSPDQLLCQLYGRLLPYRDAQPQVDALLTSISEHTVLPALLTKHETLMTAKFSLIRVLSEHSQTVNTIAINDTHIISGSADRSVKLWKLSTGELINSLDNQVADVTAVKFSPDHTKCLFGTAQYIDEDEDDWTDDEISELGIWDSITENWICKLTQPESVTSVAFSPDGSTFIVGFDSRIIRLYDTQSGTLLRTFSGHSAPVNSVAFSPDGTRVVSGSGHLYKDSNDNSLKLWDVSSGENLHTFTGHSASVRTVAFSPDGARILSGSEDRLLKLWDSWSGRLICTFKGHAGMVDSASFSPDGTLIVSGSHDATIKIWDVLNCKVVHTYNGHSSYVKSVAFDSKGTTIISGSHDTTIRLWNTKSRETSDLFGKHSAQVTALAFSNDGTEMISGSRSSGGFRDDSIKLWDTSTGKIVRTYEKFGVRAIALSPSNNHILVGEYSKVSLLDKFTGQVIWVSDEHRVVDSVAFSPDGRFIFSGDTKRIRIWRAEDKELLQNLDGHYSHWGVRGFYFSSNGSHFISSDFQTLKLWTTEQGTLVQTVADTKINRAYFLDKYGVQFNQHGGMSHTIGFNGELQLWKNDEKLTTFNGDAMTSVVAISANYSIAIGDYGGSVHILSPNATLHRIIDNKNTI